MADNTELMTEIKGIVDKQRELAEKYGNQSAEYKNYVEKSDAKLKEFDDRNDKLVQQVAEAEKSAEELKDRVKHLEAIGANGGKAAVTAEEKKAEVVDVMNALLKGQNQWSRFIDEDGNMRKAENVMGMMSKGDYSDLGGDAKGMVKALEHYREKASPDVLRSDVGELGGFLCPTEFSSELDKNIIEFAPLRSMVMVKSIGAKTLQQPLRTGIPVAEWEGELEEGGESSSKYVDAEWNPSRLTNTTAYSMDLLQSSQFNLVNEIMQDNSLAMAVAEGRAFFNGNGLKKYLGWSVDSQVPEVLTASNSLTMDDLINLSGQLKEGYNPIYTFNRKTLTFLRTLKDSAGRYIWNPIYGDAAAGAPVTINGYNYNASFIEYNDPDVDDGYPVLFADMDVFYQIVDRANMVIIRDEYTQKKKAKVEYTLMRWTSGQARIPEAGVRLKKKA